MFSPPAVTSVDVTMNHPIPRGKRPFYAPSRNQTPNASRVYDFAQNIPPQCILPSYAIIQTRNCKKPILIAIRSKKKIRSISSVLQCFVLRSFIPSSLHHFIENLPFH